jgi:intergrase/recombinase
LVKSCSESTIKDRVRYAKKYKDCLLNRDFRELNTFSDSKRSHVLKALSGLAKFLGMYEEFKSLVKAYGLKWKSGNADDLIISRLTKAAENRDVIKWISSVKAKLPKLCCFMDFVLVSGLRCEESIKAYNLIIDLADKGRLSEYYNAETEALEHFRFKKLFIRRTKKAFISFIPKTFIEKVTKQKKLTRFQIDNWIRRDNKLRSRFGDIREYYATYMTRYLKQPEIDFLQGRVSANVFMRNYFNPALISDLKERTFKAIADL